MASSGSPGTLTSNALWQQAQQCLLQGRIDAAHAVLDRMRMPGGDAAGAALLAAQIAWREDRVRDGTRHALDAAQAATHDPETLCTTIAVLLETGETVVARKLIDRAQAVADDDPVLLMRLAGFRKRLEEHAAALSLLDRAQALGYDTPALRFLRGEELLFNGRIDEAEAELDASLARAPQYGRIAVPLVRLRRQAPEHNHLAAIDRGARLAPPGSGDAAAFEFARYKTLEDLGSDDDAWAALARGNALMWARVGNEAARHQAWLDRFLAAWTSDIPHGADQPDGPLPIFIIGVPRSGTTLLERMLGNHPEVATTGELMDFGAQLHWLADTRNAHSDTLVARLPGLDYAELGRRYLARTRWRAPRQRFFVDKQPPNWVLAAAIHAALPQAPILHLVRDPMDLCFSNWRAYFGTACAYSYDLDALAAYHRDYRRVMAHWHRILPGAILDVPYADLVHEPDATLRRVFDFCGLPWEPGCTDITRNAAPSATLSAAQVREPLRRDTAGQWRRYASQLAPLADALAASGTLE